jgi:hypothetical protein
LELKKKCKCGVDLGEVEQKDVNMSWRISETSEYNRSYWLGVSRVLVCVTEQFTRCSFSSLDSI